MATCTRYTPFGTCMFHLRSIALSEVPPICTSVSYRMSGCVGRAHFDRVMTVRQRRGRVGRIACGPYATVQLTLECRISLVTRESERLGCVAQDSCVVGDAADDGRFGWGGICVT